MILPGPPLLALTSDINQVTTSSLASALGRRALQVHPKKGGHATEALTFLS